MMPGAVAAASAKVRSLPRPFITTNFAITWDARISTRRGTPADFSSPHDKHRLLEIRSECDAVLATAKTVAKDNMSMGLPDPELKKCRTARGKPAYPLRVMITNSGRIDPGLRVFAKTFSPLIVFSTTRMPISVRQALADKADLWLYEKTGVDLPVALATLRREYGVRRLVCEGGARLFRALIEKELVDEIHVTLAPRIFGGRAAPTLTSIAGEYLPKSTKLRLRSMDVIDGECFLRYRIARLGSA